MLLLDEGVSAAGEKIKPMQSRLSSLIESLTNIAVGYLVAVGSQIVIFPWFGIQCSTATNFKMGMWFTGVSLVRSYVLRRWFAGRTEKR